MPRSRRPSFLTRQKEQQRRAKAAAKRAARQARRRARSDEGGALSEISPDERSDIVLPEASRDEEPLREPSEEHSR